MCEWDAVKRLGACDPFRGGLPVAAAAGTASRRYGEEPTNGDDGRSFPQ